MKIHTELLTAKGPVKIIEYTREYTGKVIDMYQHFNDRVLDYAIPPYTPEKIRRMLAYHGSDGRSFLAMDPEGKIIGQLLVRRLVDSRRGHICDFFVFVHQDYHDQNVGRSLIELMIGWTKSKGIRKIKLGVFADNKRAIHLYKEMGFKEEARLTRELYRKGKYIDEILMSLWFDESRIVSARSRTRVVTTRRIKP